MKVSRVDSLVIFIALSYILLPIIIFFFGWLKIVYAIIASLVMVIFGLFLYKKISNKGIYLINKKTFLFWIVSIIICALWLYFSGIGSFVYQNSDFWVRNPIYRDLCEYNWPVIYDLSLQPANIQNIIGSSKVAFSYYYTWWLFPALISKLFKLNELGRNIVLYLWSLIGVLLVFYLINRIVKKCRYKNLFIFICFSGLDIIGNFIVNKQIDMFNHIEWWTNYFLQYSSNTTQLYWVFNQSIPIWIITALLLELNDNKYIGSLCSLSLAYSPWATIGIIPIALYGSFRKRKEIKNVFNTVNIIVPILMLLTYGMFYLSSSGSSGGIGTTISYYRNDILRFISIMILFMVLEFGLYITLIWKNAKNDKYFPIVLAMLIISPFIFMRDGNYTMRGTIPSLFILMIYVIKQFGINRKIDILLCAIILIGSFTAFNEMNRSIYFTFNSSNYLQEEVGSFGRIQTKDEAHIKIIKDQFYIYDYTNSIFFKYLSKQ